MDRMVSTQLFFDSEPYSLGWNWLGKFLLGLITTKYDSEQDCILLAHSESAYGLAPLKQEEQEEERPWRCRTEKTADIWETSYVQDYLADYDPTRA